VDGVVSDSDLAGAHRHDPGQRLCEQQGEHPADAGVAADRGVVEKLLHDRPAVLVGDADFGFFPGDVGDPQRGVDPAVTQPGDEAVLVAQLSSDMLLGGTPLGRTHGRQCRQLGSARRDVMRAEKRPPLGVRLTVDVEEHHGSRETTYWARVRWADPISQRREGTKRSHPTLDQAER